MLDKKSSTILVDMLQTFRLDTSTEGMAPPYRGEKVALQLDEHVFTAGTETVIAADQEVLSVGFSSLWLK